MNATARDNAFYNTGSNGVQIAARGIEPQPQFDEEYNNTCNGGGPCIAFASGGWSAGPAGTSSAAQNNLCFNTSSCITAGSGNTVSNNTSNVALNPGFANGSGTFLVMPDYIPSANYSGGTPVPVLFDALGNPWPPTWELGADSSAGVPIGVNFFIQPTVTGAANHTYVAGKNGFRYDGTWLLDSVVPTKCAGGTDPSGLFTSTFNPVALTGLSSTTGNLSYSSAAAGCGTGSAYKFFAGDGAWSVQALHNMSGSQWIARTCPSKPIRYQAGRGLRCTWRGGAGHPLRAARPP